MLGENSFVEFWGRMRKKTLDEAAEKVLADGMKDEVEEGDGLGDGGAADLTVLAKQIDLDEIKAVLRVSCDVRLDYNEILTNSVMGDTGNSTTFPS